MKISFACVSCATLLEADAKATGQAIACPKCGTSLTVPSVRPGPGVTIGGFRIKKLIARGGMGEVYLAEQLSLGRDVALKILPPHFKSDPETVQRFLSEVRTAAKFQHPNLVTVYEAGEDSGIYFLAMAYIDGETLDSILEKKGALPEARALEIVHEIAGALSAAWQSHRLIHCDVKPGNIMVDRNGKPHLMDMGLSKLLAESTATAKTSDAFGTPNYVSPEQSFNEPNLDFRSDMFSLGMTLYHMLTGRLPFDAPTPSETLHKLDTETLPDPRTIVSGISPGCVVLLERMLGRKPSARYSDWDTFLKGCQRVRKSGKLLQAALEPGESVLGRATGPATGLLPQRRGAQPSAQPKTVSRKVLLLELAGLAVVLAVVGVAAFIHRDKVKGLFAKPETPPSSPVLVVQTNIASPTSVTPTSAPPQRMSGREMELQSQFRAAQRYEKDSPDDFPGIMRRYREIQKEGAGTVWADKATMEVGRLEAARKSSFDEVRKHFQAEVSALVAAGKLEEAIALLRNYKGPLQKATEAGRMAQADKLQAQLDAKRAASEKIQPFLSGVTDELLRADFASLKRRLAAAETDPALSASSDCKAVAEMALKVAAMPEAVLASLKRDIGKTILLRTLKGENKGEIVNVVGDVVQLKKTIVFDGQAAGFVEEKYRVSDLTAAEWLQRLTEDSVEQQLMRGLLTYYSRAVDRARDMFQRAGHPLGALLANRIGELQSTVAGREKAALETAAEVAYIELLELASPDFLNKDAGALPGLILRTRITNEARGKLQVALQNYWTQHGKTEWAKARADVLVALVEVGSKAPRIIRVDDNAFDKAIEKLRADNPGGELNCRATLESNGIILNLRGSQKLTNLSALAGQPIKDLNLEGCTELANIAPLADMPLEILNLDDTLVEDLSPLQGAPLKELSLNRCTRIRSLRPLKDSPLEHLSLLGCPDSLDLTPVRSLPGIKIDK